MNVLSALLNKGRIGCHINDTCTCIYYVFYIDDSDSDILFNIHVDIYIAQQNNSLFDNYIVYIGFMFNST